MSKSTTKTESTPTPTPAKPFEPNWSDPDDKGYCRGQSPSGNITLTLTPDGRVLANPTQNFKKQIGTTSVLLLHKECLDHPRFLALLLADSETHQPKAKAKAKVGSKGEAEYAYKSEAGNVHTCTRVEFVNLVDRGTIEAETMVRIRGMAKSVPASDCPPVAAMLANRLSTDW